MKTMDVSGLYDSDMVSFKNITDELQKNDNGEIPGQITILDDLERALSPHPTKYVEMIVKYKVPEPETKSESEKNFWDDFFFNILNW